MGFKGFRERCDLQNFTGIPNEFFDEELKKLDTLAEVKILLAIFRKTYGWVDYIQEGVPVYKVEESISYSQFRELTGLTDSSIADGLKRLLEKGYIEQITKGNMHGVSSRYRLCQKVSENSEVAEEGKQEEDIEEDKEILLAEIENIGRDTTPKAPKQRGRKTFKEKALDNWNCNDLLAYFSDRYRTFVGIPYQGVTGKERRQAKALIENSGLKMLEIVKVVDFYLKNYKEVKGHPEGYPSWAIFYGWRNTIFPQALVGNKGAVSKENNVREYKGDNDSWVPNSWE